MSDDRPDFPDRRALIIYYDDTTADLDVYADEFGWLEVPELLRLALDWVEANQPCPIDTDTEE